MEEIILKYSEEQLQGWTTPLSKTEELRAQNTIKMIRSAIDANEKFNSMDIEVFIQGSYANNTNVRTESDVDVCVMLKNTFHAEYPEGKTREDYDFVKSNITFSFYRELVKKAIQDKFGSENVKDGNKSLKINENTYHVKADVVPAFLLRNYRYYGSLEKCNYIEGVWFVSKDNNEVVNYPKRHIVNGKNKNNRTNYRYKKLARIMKCIKNNMVDDDRTNGNIITSFLVECLVYQVPDYIIAYDYTWTELVRQTIIFLWNSIDKNKHMEWGEVSEMFLLFYGRKWTDVDVKQWLEDTWSYLGYGD